MKMVFDADEILAVLQQHVVAVLGVPEGSITGISWRALPKQQTGHKRDELEVIVGVKTQKGTPYREPG